jgi:hypothetical protein
MWKTHAWFNLILDTPKHVDAISTKQQVKQVTLMLHHSSKFNLASVWASWVIYSWSDWLISPYHPWIIWKKILHTHEQFISNVIGSVNVWQTWIICIYNIFYSSRKSFLPDSETCLKGQLYITNHCL